MPMSLLSILLYMDLLMQAMISHISSYFVVGFPFFASPSVHSNVQEVGHSDQGYTLGEPKLESEFPWFSVKKEKHTPTSTNNKLNTELFDHCKHV